MAKGNIFMGTVKGRIGNNVFYVKQGEQNIIKYQPEISNPKTGAQCIQRGKFGSAGKFFTHGTQALFKFAFENKKKGESDFNAFMRENISTAYPLSKQAIEMPEYPVINDWLVTKGSLPAPGVHIYLQGRGNTVRGDFLQNASNATAPTTVGEFSSRVISANGYKEGDIITFLLINSFAGNQSYPAISPAEGLPSQSSWDIWQLMLDTSNNTTLSSLGFTCTADEARLYISHNSTITNESVSFIGGTVIVSRKTNGGLKVSTNRLSVVNNDAFQPTLQAVKAYCATEAYKSLVIASWQDSGSNVQTTDIILEGALVSKANVVVTGSNPIRSNSTEASATKFTMPFDPRGGALFITYGGVTAEDAIANADSGEVHKFYYNKTAGLFIEATDVYAENQFEVKDNGDGTYSLWGNNDNQLWYVITAYEDERGNTLDFTWSLPNA